MIFNDTFKSNDNVIVKDRQFFQNLKTRIHRRLIDKLDLSKLEQLGNGDMGKEIKYVIEALIAEDGVPLNQTEREHLIVEIQHETFGLGPLEPLLADPEISDILVN